MSEFEVIGEDATLESERAAAEAAASAMDTGEAADVKQEGDAATATAAPAPMPPPRMALRLLHKTETNPDGRAPFDDRLCLPGALRAFHGRLLASVGRLVRIYDMGKKKLLRKCENRQVSARP